jgi:excisionase family DNA binding protein
MTKDDLVTRADLEALEQRLLEAIRSLGPQTAAPDADDVMTVDEAARVARVSTKAVRRWISERKLVALRAGRAVRVRRSDLNRFMRERPAQERPAPADEAARILQVVRGAK